MAQSSGITKTGSKTRSKIKLGSSPPLERPNMSNTEQVPEYDHREGVSVTGKQRLNLVLCGSDETLKKSVSKRIRGKKKYLPSLHQKEKECVRRDVKVHGRLISLVDLPALNQLSEEEVMRQTLHCVSLCDPGVHVFLFIVPVGPLTDEDKAEIEKIQKRFSSRINEHALVLITQEKNMASKLNTVSPSDTETFVQPFGGQCFVLENSSQVPALLQDVENIVKQNNGRCYTTLMCLQAQVELERSKHRAEIEELRRAMMKTQSGVTHDNVRIVLLGRTGDGKSATGNTILRRQAFMSKLTSRSVTRECQKKTSEFNRRQITVIDTPGLFDTGVDNVETRKEIVKCVSMAAPGPHVFLLVIQLGRFTKEAKDTVKIIQETFGEKSRMYTMVLFTRGDGLGETTIEDFIEDDESVKNLIQQFGQRYHVFNNNETKDQTQVSELLDKIDCMVTANGESFYTNEMFQMVEKTIKEEQERILKEKEEENKRKEEELKAKNQAELEQMKKENERERQEMQNKLRKREEEFKKKEEEIKKETDENLREELQRKLEEQQKQFEEENERKEKALGKQQQNFIKYLEEKHEKDKQKLQEKIQQETREQSEREFRDKLEKEVAKALEEAEEKHKTEMEEALKEAEEKYKREALQKVEAKLPYSAKRARDWSQCGGSFGAAAAMLVGSTEDIVLWIIKSPLGSQAQNKSEG